MADVATRPTQTQSAVGEHRKDLLYDIYKKEAEDFMTEQNYSRALKSYNLVCVYFLYNFLSLFDIE